MRHFPLFIVNPLMVACPEDFVRTVFGIRRQESPCGKRDQQKKSQADQCTAVFHGSISHQRMVVAGTSSIGK